MKTLDEELELVRKHLADVVVADHVRADRAEGDVRKLLDIIAELKSILRWIHESHPFDPDWAWNMNNPEKNFDKIRRIEEIVNLRKENEELKKNQRTDF